MPREPPEPRDAAARRRSSCLRHRTGPGQQPGGSQRPQRARGPLEPRSLLPAERSRTAGLTRLPPAGPPPASRPQPDQPDRDTAAGGLDHPAPVDHQGDMAAGGAAGWLDDQVTWPEPTPDPGQAGELAGRGPGDPHPGGPPGGPGQPRAVERAGAFGRPPVRLAPLAKGVGNGPGGPADRPPAGGSRQGRRPAREGRQAGQPGGGPGVGGGQRGQQRDHDQDGQPTTADAAAPAGRSPPPRAGMQQRAAR